MARKTAPGSMGPSFSTNPSSWISRLPNVDRLPLLDRLVPIVEGGAMSGSVCVSVPLCFFLVFFSSAGSVGGVELRAASHTCESLGSLWQLLKERVAEHSTSECCPLWYLKPCILFLFYKRSEIFL
ncbi:hypothetical protein AMECASPLE_026839 [Ameca splendens]|uniref:Uncharacterized protein n=1 Tax=Ameca splendens TaxID=208324 RepID=A0ABV0ZPV8_9TELE